MPKQQALRGAVPTTYVLLLYEYLDAIERDAQALLGEPPPASAATQAARFPVARWKALLERAAARLDDPLLGLKLGQHITPAHFGLMGYALLACATLGAALQRLRDFERLFYDVSPLRVSTQHGHLRLEWGKENGCPGALVDEAAITALVQLARDLTGDTRLAPREVHFVNEAPDCITPYEHYFGCPVMFAMPTTRVALPIALLEQRLRNPDPRLLDLLQRQARAQLDAMPPRGDLVAQTRQAISALLPNQAPSVATVATRLHVSQRSLHRRLQACGTSFREVREECLHQLAMQYLADRRLQLSEIALLLGYSEQSAFTRAFRRWNGKTPHQFRQSLQRPGVP